MALARTRSVALVGVTGHLVDVEAAITSGTPGLHLVGLPDTALSEARDRVRAAIMHSGEEWPVRHTTVALGPAGLPKAGAGFDVAIAVAILAAAGELPLAELADLVMLGELGLDGRIRPIPGVLPAVLGAVEAGCRTVVVPRANQVEAELVPDVKVIAVGSLRALLCHLRPLLARLRAAWAGLLCSLLVVALTLACTAVTDYFQLFQLAEGGDTGRYLRHGLIGLIMSALLLRYFYLQSQWRRQQQAELRARLEALQARIRPHFLFNSLNSIASLVASDPRKAEQAVLDLSDLFRASLAKPGSLVTWKEELELGRRYLSIEQYRLGPRLQLEWQVDGVPDDLPIPQLTLQPLLENALIHGVQPRIEGGLVRIEAEYRDGVFQLCVSNPCADGTQPQSSRGTRQGLANVEGRLAALFGPAASLSVDRRDGRHYTCLRYPCARLTQEARAQ